MADFQYQATREGSSVHVTLSGVMTGEAAAKAIAAFEQEIPVSGRFALHVHLKGLDRYEPDARKAWTEALSRVRDRCTKIVLYGAKPLVRMAAATVALIIRLPMDFVD